MAHLSLGSSVMDEETMRMVGPVLRVPVNAFKCWLDDRKDLRPVKKLIREGFSSGASGGKWLSNGGRCTANIIE